MENDEIKISMSISPTWNLLNVVRDKTEKFLVKKKVSREVIDATIMCATELMENAIKYCPEGDDDVKIKYDIIQVPGKLRVTVTNEVKSLKDAQNVKDHIEKVKKTDNAAKLYMGRLVRLIGNPAPGTSQLGLYRIVYEGGFKLDYKYKKSVLTVIAERKI